MVNVWDAAAIGRRRGSPAVHEAEHACPPFNVPPGRPLARQTDFDTAVVSNVRW